MSASVVETFTVHQNDTGETIAYDCTDIPASVSAVLFIMRLPGATTAKVTGDGAFTPAGPSAGRASYVFTGVDTNTRGLYSAEFQLTLADGTIHTYPNVTGALRVKVEKDQNG